MKLGLLWACEMDFPALGVDMVENEVGQRALASPALAYASKISKT